MVAQPTAASSPPTPWKGARRIAGPDDVARVLAAVNAGGARRANTAALRRPVAAADDLAERAGGAAGHLPAHPLVAPLLPWPGGLRRGATVAVTGGASLLLALLAGAMSTGGWVGVVGLPSLGAVAAAEHRVPLQRLALAPHPGPDWPAVARWAGPRSGGRAGRRRRRHGVAHARGPGAQPRRGAGVHPTVGGLRPDLDGHEARLGRTGHRAAHRAGAAARAPDDRPGDRSRRSGPAPRGNRAGSLAWPRPTACRPAAGFRHAGRDRSPGARSLRVAA
jgi:hypothetical protein